MPKNYRKKPVVVQAGHFDSPDKIERIAAWCNGRACSVVDKIGLVAGTDNPRIEHWIEIPTLEGLMRANLGDYIVRGVKGEFYPVKPEIFAATYELAEDGE